jgi:hypothetical protein
MRAEMLMAFTSLDSAVSHPMAAVKEPRSDKTQGWAIDTLPIPRISCHGSFAEQDALLTSQSVSAGLCSPHGLTRIAKEGIFQNPLQLSISFRQGSVAAAVGRDASHAIRRVASYHSVRICPTDDALMQILRKGIEDETSAALRV